LTGLITDPRTLARTYPHFEEPATIKLNTDMLVPPPDDGQDIELEKGPNIKLVPAFDPLPGTLEGPVLLKVGDDISTDEIIPAGATVLPFRSNIPEISKFVFHQIDAGYYERTLAYQDQGSMIVGGDNYGQGSSREHAALAPRYLGVKAVIAKSFARIHRQNLINFGILPLTFAHPADWAKIEPDDVLRLSEVRRALSGGPTLNVVNLSQSETYVTRHALSERQIAMILAGSLINLVQEKQKVETPS
jgi:aconitate hydratase